LSLLLSDEASGQHLNHSVYDLLTLLEYKKMKIDIIIVNWNAGTQLKECIDSIQDSGNLYINKVFVVDNASSDLSIEIVEKVRWDIDLVIIKQSVNYGFGKACNIAAQKSSAEYILFLNPDAKIFVNTLPQVIDFMDKDENKCVGVCGIQLIDEAGHVQKHCARLPTIKTYIGHATGLSKIFPKKFPYIFLDEFDHLSSRDVEHVIGAFYLIRNTLFKELKGFDETFFVYLEDLDLSHRVLEHGKRIHYLGSASAFHKGGGTSEQVKATRLFYSLRSRMLYGFKHFSKRQAWCLVFLTCIIEFIPRILKAIMKGSIKELNEILGAYLMLWKGLPKIIKKGNGFEKN